MRRENRSGRNKSGKVIKGYPIDVIYKEVAFIAYYFKWPHDDIMDMPHGERLKWCSEISAINRELNDEPENIFGRY